MQNNKRLRILFLLPDVPFPISDGMRWKVFYLLKYLSKRHQCDVISFTDGRADVDALKSALPNVNWLAIVPRVGSFVRVIQVIGRLLVLEPPSLGRFYSRDYLQRFHEALKSECYDVVHFDIVNIAQFWRDDVASVHSPNDATSLFYSRMADSVGGFFLRLRLRFGALLLRRFERRFYPKFSKVHVVAQADALYLRQNVPDADIEFIPFGIEPEALVPAVPQADADAAPLVLILGGANVPGVAVGIEEFVEKIIPLVVEKYPNAEFRIQGRGTDRLLERLRVPQGANVHASTWVDDLNALIRSAAVVVLPDKAGTGIKTRALQALACGAPIVGTQVAFEGLQAHVENGRHCLISSDYRDLAQQLDNLLSNEGARLAMRTAAATLAQADLSWAQLGPRYESLYLEAVEKYRGSRGTVQRVSDSESRAPKLSVCIPAYNRAHLLPPLLDSILSQDYANFEVVIVEDASPGRGEIATVAESYARKHLGRVVYQENPINLGYDGNLRRLIEVATGDYVVFMGNDDLMAEGALSAIAAAIQRYPQVGVLLRSYSSFKESPQEVEQIFRYFDHEAFFPAGPDTIVTFFRRCVFISGIVVHRGAALDHSTDDFDGTLLYQQHLIGQILSKKNGVYLTKVLSYHRLGGTPDFGNSAAERGVFVPREQTVESSVHFMRGMFSIAKAIEDTTGLQVYGRVVRDVGNYSYPILAVQAWRPRKAFIGYIRSLASLGLWRVPMFYVYAFGLLLLGRDLCDRVIAAIKRHLGRAPKIGQVYSGQE